MAIKSIWRDLSVSKKLYIVVGIMGLLIAVELFTLRFAMTTLSSVRAFVGGEGLWSKAQKAAVLNLEKYAHSRDNNYYRNYEKSLLIPTGDRQARLELFKENPDFLRVEEGFAQGQVDKKDIPGVIYLVRRFHNVPALHRALVLWEEGDELLRELMAEAKKLNILIEGDGSPKEIDLSIKRIDMLDDQLTTVENNFSYALGEGSRWLEHLLLTVLLLAVLTIEGTGVLLTLSFSRNLSSGLRELSDTTAAVGQGDFSRRIPVRSKDELGQLAHSLNLMTATLENSVGEQKQAERASEVKSLFLANMSHEIRTPLGAMLGFAELLKDKKLSDEDREQYVEIILRTGNNLSKILHDILDLSKVEAGQIEIDKIQCSLSSILQEIREVMEIKSAEKGLRLVFISEGVVPEIIFTDEFRLRQILTNMIGNAIKFTDKGEVRVHTKVEEGSLTFLIVDSGVGLTVDQGERLFQAFSQADSSSARKRQGTGLGLILSRRLAVLLGGDVVLLSSKPGVGSVFSVRIGLETPPEITSTASRPAPTAGSPTLIDDSFSGKHILIVDDAADNRYLMEKILTKRGATVEQAENGVEGVEKALAGDFDLVLMDVQMPVMDGFMAVSRLRQENYVEPVIAITAHAMKGDKIRCMAAGFSDYLTKPIQLAEFLPALRKHLL
jgi:two-component system, sensor histidine kinase